MLRGLTVLTFILAGLIEFISGEAVASSEFFPCTDTGREFAYDFSKDSNFTSRGNEGYTSYQTRTDRRSCQKEWTILVFMAADNDLTPYAMWDLFEMERQVIQEANRGVSTDKVDVLVEVDTYGLEGIRRLHVFQTDRPYLDDVDYKFFQRFQANQINSPIVEYRSERAGKRAQSKKDQLTKFLKWGVQNYPSDHYMVIIWGHGEGYLGKNSAKVIAVDQKFNQTDLPSGKLLNKAMLEMPVKSQTSKMVGRFLMNKTVSGGVAFDYTNQDYLNIPDVKEALEVAKTAANKKKIDILAFDACLMQTAEVASELQGTVDYIVGSTQIQNFLGLPYRSLLDEFNLGSVRPIEMAKKLPALADFSYSHDGIQGRVDPKAQETFTLSAITSSDYQTSFLPEMRKLAEALVEYLKEDPMRGMDIRFFLEYSPSFMGETRDTGLFLGGLLKILKEEALRTGESENALALRTQVQKTYGALQAAMASSAFGDIYKSGNELVSYFQGISVWLPNKLSTYQSREVEFSQSQFFQGLDMEGIGWREFLDVLYR